MKNGHYSRKPTDFSKLTCNVFQPSFFFDGTNRMSGCGPSALGLLTGVAPLAILEKNRWKPHCSDNFMVKFLRQHKWRVFEITKCNLTNTASRGEYEGLLKPNHILLTSQLVLKNEASWFVYWNSIQYHNFDMTNATFSSLACFPILSAYILFKAENRRVAVKI